MPSNLSKFIISLLFVSFSGVSQIEYRFTLYEKFPELEGLDKDFRSFFSQHPNGDPDNILLKEFLKNDDVRKELTFHLSGLEVFLNAARNPKNNEKLKILQKKIRNKNLSFIDYKFIQKTIIQRNQIVAVLKSFIEEFSLESVVNPNLIPSMGYEDLKSTIFKLSEIEPGVFSLGIHDHLISVIFHYQREKKTYESGYYTAYLPLKDDAFSFFLETRDDQKYNHLTQWLSTKEVSIKDIIELYLEAFIVFGVIDTIEIVDGTHHPPADFEIHDDSHNNTLIGKKSLFEKIHANSITLSRREIERKLSPYRALYKKDLSALSQKSYLEKVAFFYFWMSAVHEKGNLLKISKEKKYLNEFFYRQVENGKSSLLNPVFFGTKKIWGIEFSGKSTFSKKEVLSIFSYVEEYKDFLFARVKGVCVNALEVN